MKNKIISTRNGAIILLVGGLLIVGTTLAILQSIIGTKTNSFSSVGRVNVGVVENGKIYETGNGQELDKVSNDPNNPSSKLVAIKNINSEDYPTTNTYVRVRLVPSFVYDSGEHAGETVATDIKIAADVSEQGVHYNFADNNWTPVAAENGETYYYYKNILAPNAISENLLASVYYDGPEVENAHFELQVLVEGIQANSTGDQRYGTAIEAWELKDSNQWNQTIDWGNIFSNKVKK